MMINGKPQLACQTFLRDRRARPLRIEALKHFPIERDLVVTVSGFISKLESIFPYIIPKTSRATAEGEYLQTPAQLARFENFSDCINCMLCYAACPQFGLNPDFLGPGVLALLHRYNADSRDGGRERAHGAGHCRGRRLELHRGRLLLGGLPQARRSGQRGQPEQDQQRRRLLL